MSGYILLAVCVVLVLLPPKFDPAIWRKEKNEAWRKRLERE